MSNLISERLSDLPVIKEVPSPLFRVLFCRAKDLTPSARQLIADGRAWANTEEPGWIKLFLSQFDCIKCIDGVEHQCSVQRPETIGKEA